MPKRESEDEKRWLATSLARRRERFAVRVSRVRPCIDPAAGEFEVHLTHNGRQWHVETYLPEEWRRVREAVDRFLARQAREEKESW